MIEVVSTSETLVDSYETTRCSIPEDSHLQGQKSFQGFVRNL